MKKTLVLIDGHSLAYRMHFALEHTRMSTSQKEPSWAVFGFFNAIFSLLKQIQPDAIALSFDVGKVTFRNDLYDQYKAHRESMPDALRQQMARIKEGVQCLGIPIYELPGYEADDVIGTLAQQGKEQGVLVKILTGDQDSFQLVDDGAVEILIPPRNPREGLKHYHREEVFQKFGVYPEQVIDFKGLKGDTSDNIPGVPGIGDKTAAKLLGQYQTLENLYDHIEELPANKLKEKLVTFKDQAFLSKKLATIVLDAPVQLEVEDCHLVIPDMARLIGFLGQMEFKSFIQQAPTLLAPFLNGDSPHPPATQTAESALPLFSGEAEVEEEGESGGVAVAVGEPADGNTQLLLDALAYWSVDHQVITTPEALHDYAALLKSTGVFAIDLETSGLDVYQDRIVGFALSVVPQVFEKVQRPAVNLLKLKEYPQAFDALALKSKGQSLPYEEIQTAYIPVGHQDDSCPQLSLETVLGVLGPILRDEGTLKLVHNAKFEINMLGQAGVPLNGLVFDTMMASYVNQPERRHGLKIVTSELLHHRMKEITVLIGTGKKEIPFTNVPIADAAPYAACDARATLELAHYFLKTMPESSHHEQWTLFYEMENPLTRVLGEMERTGIRLNTGYLKILSKELNTKLEALEKEVYALAGCTFNLNSPKQVGEVLFEKLGIKPLKKTASKSAYSTDAKVLEALAEEHAVVQKLLDYRQLFKLQSTYVDNFPNLINPVTHRVHTSFNQTIAATGRLSSTNPNLQNIPIRSDVGRLIRQAFIPEDPQTWFLMSADYSQIELRLLAHFSQDPNLIKAFKAGDDVHATTAALVFGVPLEQVTKDMRYKAKTVNFGVVYGQSAHSLSQQLKITRYEAQQFIDLYFSTYSNVKACIEGIKAEAHRTGKVKTLYNRVRDLTEGLNSKVRSIREFSERAAFNTPLQGSAADLMKVAMIRLHDRLISEKLQSKLLLQVHDELVIEGPKGEEAAVRKWVEWAMALDQPLAVPLVIDIHVGPSWMET